MGIEQPACYPRLIQMKAHSNRSRPILLAALAGLALLASACVAPMGNYFAPTAAVVNGEKVSESKISAALALALTDPQSEGIFSGPSGLRNRREAQRQVLGDIIRLEIVLQEAIGLGIAVNESEIEQRLDQIKGQFPDEAAFNKEIKDRRLSIEYIRGRLREQILSEKVTQEVTSDLAISEEEIQESYSTGADRFSEQFHVAHILVCADFDSNAGSCNATDEDLRTATSVANRARAGEDFAKLAAEFSVDPSTKDTGGDLDWRAPGTFVPEFEQAVAGLSPGAISDPVKTQFGYHVIRVIAKGRPLDEVRETIRTSLLQPRRQQAFQDWLNEALANASIRVNPKFGRYDRSTFSVVPLEGAQEPAPAPPQQQPPGVSP